ncbi:MAG: hypothetical protein HY900_13500, partial [Deltaproteobacteria bacterium]|nr:hypothetical protein [Deltaproteobacteria bacterium]
ILFADIRWDRLWPEIEEHTFQLEEFNRVRELPPFTASIVRDLTPTGMLIGLLVASSEKNVPEIREEAHKALAELIASGAADSEIEDEIANLLNGEEGDQARGLALLESVMRFRPEYVHRFRGPIEDSCASPNMVVRQIGERIAAVLDLRRPSVPPERRRLPVTYSLELPELAMPEKIIPWDAIPPGHWFKELTRGRPGASTSGLLLSGDEMLHTPSASKSQRDSGGQF